MAVSKQIPPSGKNNTIKNTASRPVKSGSITPPKGSSYDKGTWRNPQGTVIGHAPVEDAPVARAVPGRAPEHYGPIQANTRSVGGRVQSLTPKDNLRKNAYKRMRSVGSI